MSPMEELDLRFDALEQSPQMVIAVLKMLKMLEEANIPADKWVHTLAIGIAVMEQPVGREIIGGIAPTESPDVLDVEQLKHRQDVCLDPPSAT